MASNLVITFIKVYQYTLSLFFPPCCRFTPSCSQYMVDAIVKYGLFVGLLKGFSRLSRCHPFSKRSGCDIA